MYRYKEQRIQMVFLFLLVFFSVLLQGRIRDVGEQQKYGKMDITDAWYRAHFGDGEMEKVGGYLSEECAALLMHVKREAVYFPVAESTLDDSCEMSYVDSWQAERSYKGKRGHEGTDIMARSNKGGVYPIVSMSDGTVTNLGWLEKGGYRVGITSDSGTYYYYAHLESYGDIREGDRIKAGEFLGYMGDSGYGEEGTTGKFPVHLHLGIYTYRGEKEVSVNPYYILLSLEEKKLKYAYRTH